MAAHNPQELIRLRTRHEELKRREFAARRAVLDAHARGDQETEAFYESEVRQTVAQRIEIQRQIDSTTLAAAADLDCKRLAATARRGFEMANPSEWQQLFQAWVSRVTYHDHEVEIELQIPSLLPYVQTVNSSNLLLLRAEGRQQELAIRTALGAGWDSIALRVAARERDTGLARRRAGRCVRVRRHPLADRPRPANVPRLDLIAIDWRALLFTLAVSLMAGVGFGLMPPLKYGRARIAAGLRDAGRALSAASGAQCSGGCASDAGAGSVDQFGPDDPHGPGDESHRSGIH
jgi:hypothetical protein